ncbi:hypothetical protein BDW67DRAFT_169295 [Aspergillus spinulosporus]
MGKRNFKVIVVGGSIAGLTLAHSLDLAGIDYIVLEKHSDPLATVGGSIGLLPNGWRILHQLGLRHQLEQEACPVKVAHMAYPDGFVFSDNFPAAIQERQVPEIHFPIGHMLANDERFGYPLSVLTRQKLIEVLYRGLRDKSKIKVGQRVIKIQLLQNGRGVSVLTESGQEHVGDLVAGADGVHSITRSQMWLQLGQELDTEKERHRTWNSYPHRVLLLIPRPEPVLSAEYGCVFGISSPLDGIPPGEQLIACHDDAAVLAFPGKDAHIGWGLIQKLDRGCKSPAAAHSHGETALNMAKSAAGLSLYRGLKFHDLWVNTPKYSFTLLEEGLFQIWHHGRIVCLGDSVSKMTPNMAQGANTAIEGAAALANILRRLSQIDEPSEEDISLLLQRYTRRQHKRLRTVHALSQSVTRVHTRQGRIRKIIGRYVYPYTPRAALHTFDRIIAPAPCLDYVPVPLPGPGWTRALVFGWSGHGRILLLVVPILALVYGYYIVNFSGGSIDN